ITNLPKDPETVDTLMRLKEKSLEMLAKPIVHLEEPLQIQWFKETNIMKQLTETAKRLTHADIGMLNAGLLTESFQQGDVTHADVHRIWPHPINLCVVSINGDELREVIRASLTKDFMELELKGFGFRGKLLGRMVFSGIDVDTKIRKDGQEYVTDIWFNGKPLQKDQTYSVVTADAFTFGRILPEIAKSERKDLYLPEFIRDLLTTTLKEHYS